MCVNTGIRRKKEGFRGVNGDQEKGEMGGSLKVRGGREGKRGEG